MTLTKEELDALLEAHREVTVHQCAAIAERTGQEWTRGGKTACQSVAMKIREFGEKDRA